jgi:hypothetical protein
MGLLATLLAGSLACGSSGGGSGAPAAPAFTAQPANLTVTAGTKASFTVAASGNPGPGFTWARSDDGGATWNAINGATQATYGFTAQSGDNGTLFRAVASNPSGSATSNPAALTVGGGPLTTLPAITTQPRTSMPRATSPTWREVTGNSYDGTTYFAGYWRDRTWTDLLSPDVADTEATYAKSPVVSGSDLYVGGYYLNSTGLDIPGYWLNGEWTGLAPAPATMVNGKVLSLAVVP